MVFQQFKAFQDKSGIKYFSVENALIVVNVVSVFQLLKTLNDSKLTRPIVLNVLDVFERFKAEKTNRGFDF